MKLKLLFLLLLFAASTFAQKQDNTLLYKIEAKGLHTSYLFGTTHIIADSAFYFPEKLEKTLKKTDVLVLEIDNLSSQTDMERLMKLETGSAFDIFTPEQADSVINWGAAQLNMTPKAFREGFEHKKPFSLMQVGLQTSMKGPVKMYELELMGRARMNKQVIMGLETANYQMALFDSIPDSLMAQMILDPVRDPNAGLEVNKELTRLYIAQDVEGLSRLILDSDEIGGNAEAFILRRNRNWIPRIGILMATRSCFFAVGAGHLGGTNGLLQLLKNAGYTITPIHY